MKISNVQYCSKQPCRLTLSAFIEMPPGVRCQLEYRPVLWSWQVGAVVSIVIGATGYLLIDRTRAVYTVYDTCKARNSISLSSSRTDRIERAESGGNHIILA